MIAKAAGADIEKLKFGHRGGNHPVMNLLTRRVEITAQNHGFGLVFPSLGGLVPELSGGVSEHRIEDDLRFWVERGVAPVVSNERFGRIRLTHVNLNDGTAEGVQLLDAPAFSVQYHPRPRLVLPMRITCSPRSCASWTATAITWISISPRTASPGGPSASSPLPSEASSACFSPRSGSFSELRHFLAVISDMNDSECANGAVGRKEGVLIANLGDFYPVGARKQEIGTVSKVQSFISEITDRI